MAQDPLASLLQSALAKKKKETRDVLNPIGSELSKPSPMSPLATATGPISVSEPEKKAPSLSEALSKTKDKKKDAPGFLEGIGMLSEYVRQVGTGQQKVSGTFGEDVLKPMAETVIGAGESKERFIESAPKVFDKNEKQRVEAVTSVATGADVLDTALGPAVTLAIGTALTNFLRKTGTEEGFAEALVTSGRAIAKALGEKDVTDDQAVDFSSLAMATVVPGLTSGTLKNIAKKKKVPEGAKAPNEVIEAISDDSVGKTEDSGLLVQEEIEIDKKRATQAEPEAMSPKLRQATPEQMRKLGFDEKKIKSILEARGEAYVAPAAKKSKTKREDDQYAVDPKIAEAELAKTVPVKKVEKPKLFAKDKTAIRQPEPTVSKVEETVSKVEETAPVKQPEPVSTPEPVVSKAEPTAIAKATESKRAKNVAKKKVEEAKPVEERAPLMEEKPVVSKDMMKTRIEEGGNVIEGKEFAYNPSKLEGAKKDLESGKAKPVKLETMPDGKVSVTDGFHRVQNAVDNGLVINATLDGKPAKFDGGIVKEEPTPTELNGEQQKLAIETVTESKRSSRKKKSDEPIASETELTGDQFEIPEKPSYADGVERTEFQNLSMGDDVGTYSYSFRGITDKLMKLGKLDKAVTGASSFFTDIRNALNSIVITNKETGEVFDLGSYAVGKETDAPILRNKGEQAYKLREEYEWSDKNAETVAKDADSIEKAMDDTFSGNESLDKRWENGMSWSDVIKEKINSVRNDASLKLSKAQNDMNFIVEAVLNAEKHYGKNIREKLSPEVRKRLESIEKTMKAETVGDVTTTERAMYDDVGRSLSKEGLLYEPSDSYVHGYITESTYDTFKKLIEGNDELAKFFEGDFQDFRKKFIDPDHMVTAAELAQLSAKIATIMKNSNGFRMLHAENPVSRMVDYLDSSGTLLKNKKLFDMLKEVQNDPKVGKFFAENPKLLTAIKEQFLGLKPSMSNFSKNLAKAANVASFMKIALNPKVLFKSIVTTNARAIPKYILGLIKGQGGKYDSSVRSALDQLGETATFPKDTQIGKLADLVYTVSSGGAYDNFWKTLVAGQFMRDAVGEPPKGKTLGQHFMDVVGSMDQKKRTELQYRLNEQMASIADFSEGARSQHSYLNNPAFSKLATFARSTMSRAFDNVGMAVDGVARYMNDEMPKSQLPERVYKPLAWTTTQLVGTAMAMKLASDIYMKAFEEESGEVETEEEKEIRHRKIEKVAGGTFAEQIASMLSLPIDAIGFSLIVDTASQIANEAGKVYSGTWTLEDFLTNGKITALQGVISDLTKEHFDTTGGDFKYEVSQDPTSKAALMLGVGENVDYEVMLKKARSLGEEDKGMLAEIADAIVRDRELFGNSIGYAWDIVTAPISDVSNNEYLQMLEFEGNKKNVNETYDNIDALLSSDKPVSLDEFLGAAYAGKTISVEQPDGSFKDVKLSETLDWKNVNELATGKGLPHSDMLKIKEIMQSNEQFLKASQSLGAYGGNVNAYLSDLKKNSPSEYYSFVGAVLKPVVKRNGVASGFDPGSFVPDYVNELIKHREEDLPRISSNVAREIKKRIRDKLEAGKPLVQKDVDVLDAALGKLGNMRQFEEVADSVGTMLVSELKNNPELSKLSGKTNLTKLLTRGLAMEGWVIPPPMESESETAPIVDSGIMNASKGAATSIPSEGGLPTKSAALNLSKILGTKKGQEVRFSNGKSSNDVETLRKILDRTKSK